ncbi:uncharacterized protein [Misgurnus anguillicaudatus]|uniref:uncharacterized protein n=1 Tax=Misgurnus anguillicaudatus TaxID=75329 RepID=UPI003CCFA2FC
MAATPPSPSTFVEMESPPDISTPVWRPAQQPLLPPPRPPTLTPAFYNIPTPRGSAYPRTHVHLSPSAPTGGASVQTHTWVSQVDDMQLCSTSGAETPSSVSQHALPNTLPTPGREIQQVTTHLQGNWDTLIDCMKEQHKSVSELTREVKAAASHHKSQIVDLSTQVEDNRRQIFTLFSTARQQEESELDNLTKAMKQMITDEFQKVESTLVSEVRFMIDQLQSEVQQDIKAVLQAFQTSQDHLTTELQHCVTQTDKLVIDVKELTGEVEKGFQSVKKTSEEQLKSSVSVPPVPSSTISASPPSDSTPVTGVSAPASLPAPMVKSDHIKLTFPTFGRPSDDADPLLYLTKCQDFLALHPLPDADILATFRTVLYGTARDWWEVSRTNITTWNGFEAAFLSAFLSEDYEDELAERVRTRVQGDTETIRDFSFSYRALCKRWKADLTEGEIVKMILKNIKPYLASQLRSRVTTVEELVKLGHQLEKDFEQQLRYEDRMGLKQSSPSQRPPLNRPTEKMPVQCWRCRGQHPPGKCPHYTSPQSPQMSGSQYPNSGKHHHHSKSSGQPSNSSVAATKAHHQSANKKNPSSIPSNEKVIEPQQLIVPIRIDAWAGKAIVDTGASYTLINENLMRQFISLDQLQTWSLGPLYLANGKAEVPLGWFNTTIHLHNQSFTIPAAVLSTHALAYAVVLGLDFIFFSGLQINVIDQKYSFKIAPSEDYPFQLGNASVPPVVDSQSWKGRQQLKENKQSLSLLTAVPPSGRLLSLQPDISTDALSRSSTISSCNLYAGNKDPELPWSDVDLWKEQQEDLEVIKLMQAISENCADLKDQYEVIEGKLYQKTYLSNNQLHYRVYLPSSLRSSFLQHYHSSPLSGHGGIFKTYKRLQNVAFWPAVQESIGLTPAELQLGRKLQGPMDKILHNTNLTPDADSYDVVHHLHQLQQQAKENTEELESQEKDKLCQLFQDASDEDEEFLGF